MCVIKLYGCRFHRSFSNLLFLVLAQKFGTVDIIWVDII